MKKLISVLIACAALAALLCSCSSGGANARLVVPIDSAPVYLDPQIAYDAGAKNIIANAFEGLVSYSGEGEPVCAAAESYETLDNGKRYIFHLRENAKWRVTSQSLYVLGEDYKTTFDDSVTAHDFVFALRRALSPETRSPYAAAFFAVENARRVYSGEKPASALGVRAVDDYTLEITLTHGDGDFLHALTLPCAMPCNEYFFELTGGRYGLNLRNLIFNGPFYISNIADNSVTLRRNEKYHTPDSVMPTSIYFSINNEQSTRAQKVLSGTYDLARVTASQAGSLKNSSGVSLSEFNSSSLCLIFNCADSMLSNASLRKAISAGLNASSVAASLSMMPVGGILPESLIYNGSGSIGLEVRHEYGERAAKSHMQKALESIDGEINIRVLCLSEDETTVRTMLQGWQAIFSAGVGFSVDSCDSQTFYSRLESGDFMLAFSPLDASSSLVCCELLRFTSDSAQNLARFSSKKYDSLVFSIKSESTRAKRLEAVTQAHRLLIDSAAVVPIAESTVYYASAQLNNLAFSPAGEVVYYKTVIKR